MLYPGTRDGLFALSQQRQAVLIAEENILIDRLGPSLNEAAYTQGLSSAHAVVSVLDGLRQAIRLLQRQRW